MTQSIRDTASEMGMPFDEDVLAIAEDMERRNAALSDEIAQAWGSAAIYGVQNSKAMDGRDRIVQTALLNSAAQKLGRPALAVE